MFVMLNFWYSIFDEYLHQNQPILVTNSFLFKKVRPNDLPKTQSDTASTCGVIKNQVSNISLKFSTFEIPIREKEVHLTR